MVLLTLTVGGCGEAKNPDPGVGGLEDSASYDGTSGGVPVDVGAGLLDPGECLGKPRTGAWGYKYQCKGFFISRIGFTYEDVGLDLYVPSVLNDFGDEPYEQAKVMACCGELDEEAEISELPTYTENCLLDFRQTGCMSLAAGLAVRIESGAVPLGAKPKAWELQNWLADHTEDCIAGLVDTNANSWSLTAMWVPPSNGPWSGTLEDVYVEVVVASIADLYAPEEPEICLGITDNDGVVFTDESGTPFAITIDVELDEADGNLLGPVYGGGRIAGAGEFASLSTSCSAPYCSTVSFSFPEVGDEWALDSMRLYADGPLIVSNGDLNQTITDVRIELYQQAIGDIITFWGFTFFRIPVGGAHFIVGGKSGGEVVTLPVSNSTVLMAISMGGGAWWFDEFELEYVDDASDTWTLTVSQSEWL